MSNEQKLLKLIAQVEQVSPRLVDRWQTMAIIESLGYTDRIIAEEFGFADVLAIGEYIYQQNNPVLLTLETPQDTNWKKTIIAELYAFVEQFSRSFVYAIPLISLLILSNLEPSDSWKFIPPQLAALFTLATLASLITSGGFVQAIARRGEFYFGLGFPQQARKACVSLLSLGMLTSFVLAVMSLWFGFYRNLFPDQYLVLGAFYYLVLSLLWMLLSILSLLSIWGTPLTLIGLTVLFWMVRFKANLGALEAQIVAIFVTLIFLAIAVVILLRKRQLAHPIEGKIELPNLSATIYLLASFFGYGITYFCFIFADRLVAGWAVDAASGLIFAIDSAYQRAMDLALLNFLLAVPLSEYLAYRLIRYWYKQAQIAKLENMSTLSKQLNLRYLLLIGVILLFFGLLVASIIGIPTPKPWASTNPVLTLIGCLGYLLLVLGLLNAVVLFNLNLASSAIASIFPSLIVNFVIGYLAANAIAPEWAVLGLVVGSLVFMLLSRRKVLQAMQKPDYAYYLGGY
ncbi:hypothetical protein Sta7437_1714 [Stanieria cyanosphaera PCC 7437]|uniref:Uncharacterized protein n=1 Tax=Stanieria cyanosphaera (strain ATCC 29371 / PCC 7437) TaxID=111780 RepID=K9XT70_STAC7|nr:cell wall-binding repeat-containing protein [Stanieria cyanosphaera]AFZ35276.1 hypothetical protein Sta7437_1714 [Stanieria cyanosphaera PCC 7437]